MTQVAGHGEKLSRNQELAIAALLGTSTITAAAQRAGVAEHTLRNWLKRPGFAAAYRQARAQVLDEAIAQVQQATTAAVQTLAAVMADPEAPASARVTAAKEVLATALKVRELDELEGRLVALEARLMAGPTFQAGPHFDRFFEED